MNLPSRVGPPPSQPAIERPASPTIRGAAGHQQYNARPVGSALAKVAKVFGIEPDDFPAANTRARAVLTASRNAQSRWSSPQPAFVRPKMASMNRLLDLSKIEAGKLELNPQTVPLAP